MVRIAAKNQEERQRLMSQADTGIIFNVDTIKLVVYQKRKSGWYLVPIEFCCQFEVGSGKMETINSKHIMRFCRRIPLPEKHPVKRRRTLSTHWVKRRLS